MKKVYIPALLLAIAVALSVWAQLRPSDSKPSKKDPVKPGSLHIAQLSDPNEDSLDMPEIPIREEEGVLLDGDTEMTDAPEGYFENALFIGDSRMHGLQLYGDIKEGTWFAGTSIGVFNYHNTTMAINGGNYTLDNLLSMKKYNVIYLNMGINDIGYEMETLKATYNEFIDKIVAAQPEASLVILSNMHVTKSRSDRAEYNVTNPRINELNAAFKDRQNGKSIFYFDLNKLVDDASGNLNPSFTFDEVHLQSPQYLDISNYLRTHAIIKTN